MYTDINFVEEDERGICRESRWFLYTRTHDFFFSLCNYFTKFILEILQVNQLDLGGSLGLMMAPPQKNKILSKLQEGFLSANPGFH